MDVISELDLHPQSPLIVLLPFPFISQQETTLSSPIHVIPTSTSKSNEGPVRQGKRFITSDGNTVTFTGDLITVPGSGTSKILDHKCLWDEDGRLWLVVQTGPIKNNVSEEMNLKLDIHSRSDSGSSSLQFHDVMKMYPLISASIGPSFRDLFNSYSVKSCQSPSEVIESFKALKVQAVNIFMQLSDPLLKQLVAETDLTGEDIEKLLHGYIEEKVGDRLWAHILSFHPNNYKELFFLSSTDQTILSNISLNQVSLPRMAPNQFNKLHKQVSRSIKEFSKLEECDSTQKREDILLKTMEILTTNEPECELTINADVLVGLMLFVILRSQVKNLPHHLLYINNFSFNSPESGKLGYIMSTIEGVLYHLKDSAQLNHLLDISKKNQDFFKSIENADYEEFQRIIKEDKDSFESVIWATNTNNESGLMYIITATTSLSPFNEDLRVQMFTDLLELNGSDFAISDTGINDVTLLSAALQTSPSYSTSEVPSESGSSSNSSDSSDYTVNDKIILILLKFLYSYLTPSQLTSFLCVPDIYHRTAPHYLFNNYKLIPQISPYINWKVKDANGQTPLFAICRCYDHSQYDTVVEVAMKSCAEWYYHLENHHSSITSNKSTVSSHGLRTILLSDHIDNKHNTLLHILTTPKTISLIYKYGKFLNVNSGNEKNLTSLMVWAKYGREEVIRELCHNSHIYASAQQHPKLHSEHHHGSSEFGKKFNTNSSFRYDDIEFSLLNNKGQTAADLAKDKTLKIMLDELRLFKEIGMFHVNKQYKDEKVGKEKEFIVGVVRYLYIRDEAKFVIKTGLINEVIEDHDKKDAKGKSKGKVCQIFTVYRSLEDFEFLANLLQFEFPNSGVPSIFPQPFPSSMNKSSKGQPNTKTNSNTTSNSNSTLSAAERLRLNPDLYDIQSKSIPQANTLDNSNYISSEQVYPKFSFKHDNMSLPLKFHQKLNHEIIYLLNQFLWTLLSLPKIQQHELLWEFLLVPDINKPQCISRSNLKVKSLLEDKKIVNEAIWSEKRKLEDIQLMQGYVDYPNDIKTMEGFLKHLELELSMVKTVLGKCFRISLQIMNVERDKLRPSIQLLNETIHGIAFARNGNLIDKENENLFQVLENAYSDKCHPDSQTLANFLLTLTDFTQIVYNKLSAPIKYQIPQFWKIWNRQVLIEKELIKLDDKMSKGNRKLTVNENGYITGDNMDTRSINGSIIEHHMYADTSTSCLSDDNNSIDSPRRVIKQTSLSSMSASSLPPPPTNGFFNFVDSRTRRMNRQRKLLVERDELLTRKLHLETQLHDLHEGLAIDVGDYYKAKEVLLKEAITRHVREQIKLFKYRKGILEEGLAVARSARNEKKRYTEVTFLETVIRPVDHEHDSESISLDEDGYQSEDEREAPGASESLNRRNSNPKKLQEDQNNVTNFNNS